MHCAKWTNETPTEPGIYWYRHREFGGGLCKVVKDRENNELSCIMSLNEDGFDCELQDPMPESKDFEWSKTDVTYDGMKPGEIHIISMAVSNGYSHLKGYYVDIGCTADPDVSASFLIKNGEKKYQEAAEAMHLISFFQVRAIYLTPEKEMMDKVNLQFELAEKLAELKKEREEKNAT